VLAFPRSYAVDQEGVRKKPLRRFPYTLVDRVDEECCRLLRYHIRAERQATGDTVCSETT
jgi:hypothetical protein